MYLIRCILNRVLYAIQFGLFYRMSSRKLLPEDQAALKKLGARIKVLRQRKGYTNYEKFAFEHEISRSQLWRYENGEDLNFSSLLRIIRALDMTIADFFAEGLDPKE
jgi:hypothetical protein